ncbi:hypothetical protein TSOC_013403, partial [Tetrabaena socialis]
HALAANCPNPAVAEYCDISSAMGGYNGYGLRCYNPPEVWQLGWGSPFVLLTRADLLPGSTLQRWIPLAHTDPDHFIRIPLSAGNGAPTDASGVPASCNGQLWVSYRQSSTVYDMLWKDVGTGAVLVHRCAQVPYTDRRAV